MANEQHDLDLDWLFEAVWKRIPAQLRLVFRHYLSLSAERRTALLLPQDTTTYLAVDHPRLPGGRELGLRPTDPITLLPITLSADELTRAFPRDTSALLAFFPDDGPAPEDIGDRLTTVLAALPVGAGADLVIPHALVWGNDGDELRDFLLNAGHVTDLFTSANGCNVGWLKEEPEQGHRTQAVEIPPPDEWPEFEEDLQTWMPLWRWGDLVDLPPNQPWTWNNLDPDIVSMLLRLKAEIAKTTTRPLQ